MTRTRPQKSIEKCGGGEMLNLRMCVFIWRLGRWVSSDYNDSVFCKGETSTAIGMIKEEKRLRCKTEKSQKIKSPRKSNPPQYLWGCFKGVFVPDLTRLGMREGVFVPDLTRSGVRVRGLGLVWTSGPTRSDRDQHQTRSRTRHRNLTRLVSYVLLTSLLSQFTHKSVPV